MILTHRKYLLPVVLLLFLALLLPACAPSATPQPEAPAESATPQPETPAEPDKLQIVVLPYLSFAPFFIAQDEGYFAEQNLEVEFVQFDDAAEAVPALAQGDIDVVSGFISAGTLNAIASGETLKIVAEKGYVAPTGCATDGFVISRALDESGELEDPTQLAGRKVSVNTVSMEGYFFTQLLGEVGLTLDDVQYEDMPTPAKLDALDKGAIDLVFTSEPWLTRILGSDAGVLWVPLKDLVPDFQMGVIFYGPTLLNENPELGQRFMVAYLKAVRQYNEGKTDRNVEILAENTGLEAELLKELCWPPLRENGMINVQSILDFQDWAVEQGFLDTPATAAQLWDPSFVAYARENLE
jgi:NitT/TauT family transport system substrate-binding protein